MQETEKITAVGIFLNIVLFIAKFAVGIFSNSLAILSDAFNSLTDIISYTTIYFACRISEKKSDEDHPFGHHRAEPIAGLVVAILAGILGFEILRSAIQGIFVPRDTNIGIYAIAVCLFTIFIKTGMSIYFTRMGIKLNRPALRAAGIDSRNDVLVTSVALIGVVGYMVGVSFLDSVAAIGIGFFVIYSGYKIGKENIDYLMGHAPPRDDVAKIKKAVLKINGIKGINDVRAHYVGNYIHIEIHIEVDKDLSTQASHDLGKEVQYIVERFSFVDKAFIHIDPV
jgi:cation diffusion facilitator family transporter